MARKSTAKRKVKSAPKRRAATPKSLRRYAEKRDFTKTAEPRPLAARGRTTQTGPRFVIQFHAASHLHFDFRLEMEAVLKSWAVPKGLPVETGVRRAAFQVEDHPLDYFSFEGVIPEGEYGGGTVMVWDLGTYELLGGDYTKGDLKLWLSGRKLKGEWHLFRIKSKEARPDRPMWLIQKANPAAKALTKKQITTSALSGRTMDEIATARDAVWHSKA